MGYCVYSPVGSGAVTPIMAIAATPAQAGAAAMVLTFVVMPLGSPLTSVTLTSLSGGLVVGSASSPSVQLTPGAAGSTNTNSATFSASNQWSTQVTLVGPVGKPLPASLGNRGQVFTIQFTLGNEPETAAASLTGTMWSIEFVGLSAIQNQSFAWVVADATEVPHDVTTSLVISDAALIQGFLTAGTTVLAGVNAQSAAFAGNLTVAGATTVAGLSAQTATVSGALTAGGQSALVGTSIAGDLSVTGESTVAGLSAQSATIAGALTSNGLSTGALNVNGNASVGTLYAASGISTPAGAQVDGQLVANGGLLVDGGATIDSLSVTNNLDVTGVATIGALLVNGPGQFNGTGSMPQLEILGGATNATNLTVDGNAQVDGTLSASTLAAPRKNFLIDHPLDKAHKHLVHGCLEGPESGVYYRGSGELVGGRAVVELPDYFEALTQKEGRTVQLTPHFDGDEELSSLAASTIAKGRFQVRTVDGRNPSQRFFWEVKAERADLPSLETELVKKVSEPARKPGPTGPR